MDYKMTNDRLLMLIPYAVRVVTVNMTDLWPHIEDAIKATKPGDTVQLVFVFDIKVTDDGVEVVKEVMELSSPKRGNDENDG